MQQETTEAVYNFIIHYIHTNNYPPTTREIACACYLGTSTVLRHLDKLEAWGRITRHPGRARSIAVLTSTPSVPNR
jgi:SOS-response transcriptional repressor LexA